MSYQKFMNEFQKKGFEVGSSRKTKLANWVLFQKEREGFLSFGYDMVYLYFVDGDVNISHMNDFLKRYASMYDEKSFDEKDQGILVYKGNLNTNEFRKLAKSILNDKQYKIMKLKQLTPITIEKKSKEVKVNRVEEEEIKEKITIERETTRKVLEEVEISVNSIKGNINQWKNVAPKVSGRGREKQMTLSMTGFLASAYPDITLEEKLGGNRIDAIIGKIGIEAKYRPDQNEINRLYGQIDDYLRYLSHVIVVFFDTNQAQINNFQRKINSGGYKRTSNYSICLIRMLWLRFLFF